MGCRILAGNIAADVAGVVFYCSTTMRAFGPVMGSLEEAELFLTWIGEDPRHVPELRLSDLYAEFCTANVCECGQVRDEEELERRAHAVVKHWCMCENNGDECDFCQAKQIEKDWEPCIGESFECSHCAKEKQGTA